MDGYHEMGSLAPRDVVARAIDSEMKRSGEPCVYLDITQYPADELKERFPNIYSRCLDYNLDMATDRIPVVPAAHYMCGGVDTDSWGRTDIDGLYASGEVACTGLHGANRLASNSLLEAPVISDRACRDASGRLASRANPPNVPDWQEDDVFNAEEWVILRSDFRLNRASRRIGVIADEVEEFYKRTKVTEALLELRNITTVAGLTVRSALMRRESRGLHHNIDCPASADEGRPKETFLSVREDWGASLGTGWDTDV